MALTSLALGVLLLGQYSSQTDPLQGEPARAPQQRAISELSPAAELLSAVLPQPEEQALAGRELTLVKALAGATDRRQRHEITRAYWKLSMAVAACQLAAENSVLLDRLGPHNNAARQPLRADEQKALDAAMQSAKAVWTEAELHAIEAQHLLADLLGWPLSGPLPLPADRPHIGAYQTKFDLLFANRQAPVRTRMIDRTLPVRREAIVARAAAVQAARDALAAGSESYQAGQATLEQVLKLAAAVDRQRTMFLAAVEQYNLDIAEYVATVAREGTNEVEFAAMLIRPRTASAAPKAQAGWQRGSPPRREGATAASYDEPLGAEPPAEPPLRLSAPPALEKVDDLQAANPEPSTVPALQAEQPPEAREPTADPLSQPAGPQPPQPHTSFRQPISDGLQYNPSLPTNTPPVKKPARSLAMYAELQKLEPPEQQRQLSDLLHFDSLPPEPDRTGVTLEAFLEAVSVPQRGLALARYWKARELAAWVQVLKQQTDGLESLTPAVLSVRVQTEGPDVMVALQAARLASQADLLDSEADLHAALAELTQWSPNSSSQQWWWPETPPQAGGYPAEFKNSPQWEKSSWSHRRLAKRLPALNTALADRAAAVISADAACAIHNQHFAQDPISVENLLASLETRATLQQAMLSDLTRYNLAIGSYVLAVLPAQANGDAIALAMMHGPAAAMP